MSSTASTPKAPAPSQRFDRRIVDGPLMPAVWHLAWPSMLQNAIGGAQGIGFAIPVSNTFRRVVFTLVTEGRVRRAYLGVGVVSRPARSRNGFEGGAGVESVAPNSPAERAGVKPQDVIVGFGDTPVRSNDDLLSMLDQSAIGRDSTLRVLRGGRELTLRVRPQELPEE